MHDVTSFSLGQWQVLPDQFRISSPEGEEQVLQPKIIEVLIYLANHYPRLVSRDELIEHVWDGNFPVGEKALTNAIWHLRKHLQADEQPLIETIRKRGYRLLVEPEFATANKPEPQQAATQQAHASPVLLNKRIWVALVLIGCSLLWQLLTPNEPQTRANITQITSDPGGETFPAVAPNGKDMVYVWQKINGQTDLYLQNLDQLEQEKVQLTFDEQKETRPVWHPNGQSLFYVRKSWDRKTCHIMQLTLVSKVAKPLVTCPASVNVYLDISPNGNTLAFTGNTQAQPKDGIYLLDLTQVQSQAKTISCLKDCAHRDRNFAFSPDGKQLVVSRRVGNLVEDIFIIDLASEQSRQLTFGEGDILGLLWHPDGDKIIYGTENANVRHGHLIDLDSGKSHELNAPGFSFPSLIPGSNDLLYHHKQIIEHIAYLPLGDEINSTPFPLIQSQFNHTSVQYSKAADQLVYISNESGFNELWRANVDGSQRQQLTQMQTNLTAPRWSHDGQFIAFIGPRADKQGNHLFVLDTQTLKIKQINSPFSKHSYPGWRADNLSILSSVTEQNQRRLYEFSLTQQPPQVFLKDYNVGIGQEDHFGHLWFSRRNTQGLWFKAADSNQIERKIDPEVFVYGDDWALNQQGIYFHQNLADHHRINFYDFEQQQTKVLVKLPNKTIGFKSTLTWIARQNRLLFSQSPPPKIDIKRLSHPLLR